MDDRSCSLHKPEVDRGHTWLLSNRRRTKPSACLSHLYGEVSDRPFRLVDDDRAESVRAGLGGFGPLCHAKVLIVDDCLLYRECLVGVLAARGGAVAPGVAWDLTSLIAGIEATLPDVILLNMATHGSSMLLRQASRASPFARIVVMGVSEDDEPAIVECAEAGAAGYHLRNESLDDLVILMQRVVAGESLCSPKVSAILLRRLSALASQRPPAAEDLVLTAREVEILRMLQAGMPNREIAGRLCIAVHTVKNHVHSVLTKLGVNTREQAAALARSVLAIEDL